MSAQDGRGFNDWLRTQLRAKKMSQRQLAQQAGVDHSTISRLIRGDRTPSLGTATKLARGLREIRDEAEGPTYFGQLSNSIASPTAQVEYALRADDVMSETNVRQVMEYYLAIRMRRLAARTPPELHRHPTPLRPERQPVVAGLAGRPMRARN
jgi:transcriptional regulator with XRE-family HTH domain